MLYSNLINPISLCEYKLILESMLLQLGWFFDSRPNVEQSLIQDACNEFVLCVKPSGKYDTTLVRNAFQILSRTDLETLARVSEASDGQHSITMLKDFLKHADLKNQYSRRPADEEIDALFSEYPEWLSRLDRGESVKSIMANNPKIKFCLIRAFIKIPGFDNHAVLQANPHIVDLIQSDYIDYCRVNASIMPDTDVSLGHEGENFIDLVGTLVYGMGFFIRSWARKQLTKYISRDTSRGSGEESFDALDIQYQLDKEWQDFNVGKSLRELLAVNECILWNKRVQKAFYSTISWFQAVYIGRKTLMLSDMIKRFIEGRFDAIAACDGSYDDKTFEELMHSVIFNMSRKTCIAHDMKITPRCKAVYYPGFGKEEDSKLSQHFLDRFRDALHNFEYAYLNRGNIAVENLFLESWIITDVEKTNMEYTRLKDNEYDRILQNFKRRYSMDYIPTNTAIHDYATLLYGVNAVVNLSEQLESVGLTIMDVPLEVDLVASKLAGISDTVSMLETRNLRGWDFSSKYRIGTTPNSKVGYAVLLQDTELMEILQNCRTQESGVIGTYTPEGEPNVSFSLVDLGKSQEGANQEIIKRQIFIAQKQMDQPIYAANTTGRAKYITQSSVKIQKAGFGIVETLFFNKINIQRLLLSLMTVGYIQNLMVQDEVTSTEENYLKRISTVQKYLGKIARSSLINEEALKESQACSKAYKQCVQARIRPSIDMLRSLDIFCSKSIFCNNIDLPSLEFLTDRIVSTVRSYDGLRYLIGLAVYVSEGSAYSALNQEYRSLIKQSGITKDELMEEVAKCGHELMSGMKGLFLFQTLENNEASVAKIKRLNSVILSFNRIQSGFLELGRAVLQRCKNLVVIGASDSFDSVGEKLGFRCRRLQSLGTYDLIKVNLNSLRCHFEKIEAGKTLRSTAIRYETVSNKNIRTYTPLEGEFFLDGQTWLYPYSDKVIDPPLQVVNRELENSYTYEFTEPPENRSDDNMPCIVDVYTLIMMLLKTDCKKAIQKVLLGSSLLEGEDLVGVDDIQTAWCISDIFSLFHQRVTPLIEKYNTLIATFDEYARICQLARSGQITQDKFRKNQIAIATYSDVYQMQIIRSKPDVQTFYNFLQQMQHIYKNPSNDASVLYNEMRSVGIEYMLPVGIHYQVVYRLVSLYCSRLFGESLYDNIREILATISRMRVTLTSLFKLEEGGVKQAKQNARKFERCREFLRQYMETPGYRYASIGADRNSEVMQEMRARYSVDRSTGVFYDPDRQLYFLACASDPLALDSAKFNILCNTDGMLLVYDEEQQTFYRQPLSSVTSEIIQAILR